MRYLITGPGDPFLTKWFEPENHFNEGMTVYDLAENIYTIDGKVWQDIEIDHL